MGGHLSVCAGVGGKKALPFVNELASTRGRALCVDVAGYPR